MCSAVSVVKIILVHRRLGHTLATSRIIIQMDAPASGMVLHSTAENRIHRMWVPRHISL